MTFTQRSLPAAVAPGIAVGNSLEAVLGAMAAARFWVRDRGVGIDPKALSHIFERHWHARTSAGGETGLGLYLAKEIVEAQGYFTLPLLGEQSSPKRSSLSALVMRRRPWRYGT